MKIPTLALLLTGSELMSGDTIDSNSAMIAELIRPLGLSITRKVTVGDDEHLLKEEIARLSQAHDLLIINGGLGPTDDDLTAAVLAAVTDQPLEIHPFAQRHLEAWAKKVKKLLNKANFKQAWLPKGADIIPNPVGTAVGIQLEHQNCLILATPGVPPELRVQMQEHIIPLLQTKYMNTALPPIPRWRLFGLGESSLQQMIHEQIESHPNYPAWSQWVTIGFRVQQPLVELKLIPKSNLNTEESPAVEQAMSELGTLLENVFSDLIIGRNDLTLPEAVIHSLTRHQAKVTTAESCTGGKIAAKLTEVAGASQVFEVGYITYSNSMKSELLGVDPTLFDTDGAVSEAVVRAMVTGALKRSGADYGVAVSGIAGPGGGSDEKPVGTVWIGWGSAGKIRSTKLHFVAPRKVFQNYIAAVSLDLIRRDVEGIEGQPPYLQI